MSITKEGRDRLRELEAKATPGEWGGWQPNVYRYVIRGKGYVVPDGVPESPPIADYLSADDAFFIAAARNALIPLLDALDTVEAGREYYTAAAQRFLAALREAEAENAKLQAALEAVEPGTETPEHEHVWAILSPIHDVSEQYDDAPLRFCSPAPRSTVNPGDSPA